MGTTASGKTDLAEQLADLYDAELINADAFQVYRGLDIGTAKPTDKTKYRLLDIKSPNESYGVGEFCQLALDLLRAFWAHEKNVIVVGGTGLYIRGLFEEYSGLQPNPPEALRERLQQELAANGLGPLKTRLLEANPHAAEEVDLNNPVRVTRALERLLDDRPPLRIELPNFRRMKLGLVLDQAALSERIACRVRGMVQNGWVEEVKSLLDDGFGPADPGFRAIGYTEIANAILGRTELEEAIAATTAETRRYAKRQRTWLRSEPGLIHLESAEPERIKESVTLIQKNLSL
jgi:tRNA dimethylallyltransferase